MKYRDSDDWREQRRIDELLCRYPDEPDGMPWLSIAIMCLVFAAGGAVVGFAVGLYW